MNKVVVAGIILIAVMTAAVIVGAVLGPVPQQGTDDRENDVPVTGETNDSEPAIAGPGNDTLPSNDPLISQGGSNASGASTTPDAARWSDDGGTGSSSNEAADAEGSSPIAAVIKINEVEADPPGADRSGIEWIELYNPTASPVDLTGWTVSTTHGDISSITITGTIGASQYLVVTFGGQFIDNQADTVQIFDGDGRMIDRTPSHADTDDDGMTWQRVPDGGDGWQYAAGTRAASNAFGDVPVNSSQPTSGPDVPDGMPASDPQTTAPDAPPAGTDDPEAASHGPSNGTNVTL